MTYHCCFCGKPILPEVRYILTVRRTDCGSEQKLYCHEECLEQALRDPKLLYLKHL